MNYIQSLVRKYRGKGIIVDTNLLLVILIGLYDKNLIKRFEKTSAYDDEDFIELQKIVKTFGGMVVTPQILAEVSNLTFDKIQDPGIKSYVKHAVGFIGKSKESYISKDILLSNKMLTRFGFTDISITESVAESGYLVITDDLKLYHLLLGIKGDCININHLRSEKFLKT
jgi:hypothetical protein